MYKSIKVSDETYKEAKKLGKKLKENNVIPGMYNVSLSTAVGYAVSETLHRAEKKEKLRLAIGGWSDMDTEALKKDIYASRRKSTRKEVNL